MDCGEYWTVEHIDPELWQAPHTSADAGDAMKALHKETREKVANRYTKVIRYGELKKNLP